LRIYYGELGIWVYSALPRCVTLRRYSLLRSSSTIATSIAHTVICTIES
jgi:hypothetical protein